MDSKNTSQEPRVLCRQPYTLDTQTTPNATHLIVENANFAASVCAINPQEQHLINVPSSSTDVGSRANEKHNATQLPLDANTVVLKEEKPIKEE